MQFCLHTAPNQNSIKYLYTSASELESSQQLVVRDTYHRLHEIFCEFIQANAKANAYICTMVEIGIKGHQETTVTSANVATRVGSGRVPVFATPMMIALVEKAACLSIDPYLEEGQSSVGVQVNVSHCAATPMGMKVWADTEVTAIDRLIVSFKVQVYDERGLIGEGTHERFIVDIDKFLAKAESK